MLIYLGEPIYRVITLQEGSGDNLSEQDIKDGFTDYWMSSVYQQDGDELTLVDGGQILTSKPISEMETDEIIERVFDYWECHTNNYAILD